MLELCLFLVILYLVVVLAVTLPYWYETGNSSCEDIPIARWSFRPVVKLWLAAAWAALLLGAAGIVDPIFRLIRGKNKDGGELPPVLLIHGLYHNRSGWMYFQRHLRRAGFNKIHALGYASRNAAVKSLTEKVDAAVNELERRHPGQKPLLVGHSLGGLLIRNWLAEEENQRRVLGAVTLGAPHRGSKMAALAFGKLGKSLLPTNPLFADLARTEAPASISCVSLVSEADIMVLPQENLVPVTKGWEMRLTPYATHAGLLTRGPVLRMAVWELHRIIAVTKGETPPASGM